MKHLVLATTDTVPGRELERSLGLVEGTSAVSPGLAGGISASFSAFSAGRTREFEQVLRKARAFARREMIDQARELGADAVVGIRYTTSEVAAGVGEVTVYGTAVSMAPEAPPRPRLTAPPPSR